MLGGRFSAGQDAVGVLERVRVHEIGHDRLQRGVVDSPATRVDQHDQDQEGQGHAIAQNQERAAQDGNGAHEICDGHEWAPFKSVRERASRQCQEEPRQTVRGHDTGDGQWMGIDDDSHEGDRPGCQSVTRTCQREANPQAGEGSAEWFPPDAVLCPAPDIHRDLPL